MPVLPAGVLPQFGLLIVTRPVSGQKLKSTFGLDCACFQNTVDQAPQSSSRLARYLVFFITVIKFEGTPPPPMTIEL